MKEDDPFFARIEAYNEAKGGGVIVRRANKGYSLFVEETSFPLARLRPTGDGDEMEVLWWSHRDKWEPVTDFAVYLPLDKALDFIAEDPYGCFWM
jgi:hypothetical protein